MPDAGSGKVFAIPGTLEIDYRNILSPLKKQMACGSCW